MPIKDFTSAPAKHVTIIDLEPMILPSGFSIV
jgi:hypothetical protein